VGITYDKIIQAGGMVRANVPDRMYDPFAEAEPSVGRMKPEEFATPSGRVEIYYEKLADIGEQFATGGPENAAIIEGGTPGTTLKVDRSKYPLQYVGARHRFFTQTQFWDVAVMNKLAGPPSAWMNPKDAASRGISEGDVVELFNDRGSAKMKVHLSPMFPPGCVNGWYGWRTQDYAGGNKETLLLPHSWADTDDNISKKTGFMWDLLWDCCCEVRKAS
jgi:anaerobic selenocysteine-containing dehydrogenase